MLADWLPFLIYGFFALVIPTTMIAARFLFATRPKVAREAADASVRVRRLRRLAAQQRFTVSFYLTAMLFILFDIEIVFLYPLAVNLNELGWFGFLEFLVFLIILCSPTSTSGARERSNGATTAAAVPTGRSRPRAQVGAGALADEGPGGSRRRWPTRGAVGLTTIEKAVAWAQTKSMWPDTFGLACCAMEMMSIVSARYDIARFGMEAFRSSPRQADLLIVSGRVSHKMAAPLRQIYDQMLEPKWVIAMGACASSGGMFNNYAIAPVGRQDRRGRHLRARLPAAARAADGGDHPAARGDPGRRPARVRAPRGRRVSGYEGVPGRRRDGRRTARRRSSSTRPLVEACEHLRDAEGFDFLSDISATDYLGWGGTRRLRLHRHSARPRSERARLAGSPAPARAEAEAVLGQLPPARVSRRPAARVRVQAWLDDGEEVDRRSRSGRPPTGTSARPGT